MEDSDWELRRLFHINITCQDLERSIAFYQKLGFVVRNFVYEDSFQFSRETAVAMGLPANAKYRGCLLHAPDVRGQALLDLIEWIDPPSSQVPWTLGNSPGVPRVAVWIRNLHAAFAVLEARGIQFYGGLQGPDREHGVEYVAFTRDPDGLIVELIDFPSGWKPQSVEASRRDVTHRSELT